MPGSMEQFRRHAKSFVLMWNVCSIACWRSGGVAHMLEGLYFLPWGFRPLEILLSSDTIGLGKNMRIDADVSAPRTITRRGMER